MPAYTYSGPETTYPHERDENGEFIGRVRAGDTAQLAEELAGQLGHFWNPAESGDGAMPDAPPKTTRAAARQDKGEGK